MHPQVAVPTLRWCTPRSGGGDSEDSENSRVLHSSTPSEETEVALFGTLRVLSRNSHRDARPQMSAVCFSGRSRYGRRKTLYRKILMKRRASHLLMRRVALSKLQSARASHRSRHDHKAMLMNGSCVYVVRSTREADRRYAPISICPAIDGRVVAMFAFQVLCPPRGGLQLTAWPQHGVALGREGRAKCCRMQLCY